MRLEHLVPLSRQAVAVLRELRALSGNSSTVAAFAELPDRIEDNGVRTVIVEDASRFVRELASQELGILALIEFGVCALTLALATTSPAAGSSRIASFPPTRARTANRPERLQQRLDPIQTSRLRATQGDQSQADIQPIAANLEQTCVAVLIGINVVVALTERVVLQIRSIQGEEA